MKRMLFIFTLIFCTSVISAQKIDVKLLKGMKMRSIGPAGMSGRVTAIDVVHANPEIIYVGTASGGLWKSESGGIRWTPIFDKQKVQSIGAVAVQQSNPDVIWAGTGEGNPRNTQTSGAGIYKSLDGGKSWTLMGLEQTKVIHRIIIHRDNPDVIFVAALGSAWGPNKERGVYKTINGGETWEKILYINEQTGAADLVVDPTNPNKLLAAMWEYGRKPWFFTSGGKGSGLHITFDGGKTWKQRTDKHGLPKGEFGRIGLAIAPSKPKIIYALIETKKNALYRSNDGGFKWKKVADKNVGNRPFYYSDIYVDPKNENRVYNLYTYLSRSEDGGKTFKVLLNYSKGVHPDHHAFWVHPDDPDYLIDGNDGGLNISRDGGSNWRFIENIPVAQFYHINIDMDTPYNVYGGLQDNGSWMGPAYVWKNGGIRNSYWDELLFGDGFDVMPHRKNNRYGYAMYQGGNLYYYDRETGRSQNIKPVHPKGKTLRYNWNAGLAQDPFNDCGVYYGSQFVHKSLDCGKSWQIISSDLTTNDTSKQKQSKSGGLTIDATKAENYTSILTIAPSPIKEGIIWVGTDDGNLQLTKNGGVAWIKLTDKLKGAPKGSWIPQIEVSSHNAGEAFVVINNYRKNDWKPYAYHTIDFGKTWKRIVDESDAYGHVLSIVQDPIEPRLLFLGTENGLYFSIDKGINWNKWKDDFPSVSTMDLKIHPREHDLVIGTFGRAIYVLDDIRPLRELAKTGGKILEKPFHAFETPKAILNSYKPVSGVRFTADAHFKGQNRRRGAMISFWLKEVKEEKKEEDKKESNSEEENEDADKKDKKANKVKFHIFNSGGDTIRSFTVKPDTGLNRIYWAMTRNGVRHPSYSDPKPDADKPSGPRVLPGTYKVKISYGKYSDSTNVTVELNPRSTVTLEDLKEKEKIINHQMSIVSTATDAFNRLKEARKTIGLVNKQMENIDEELKKELQKNGKTMQDSIKQLMDLFMKPKDFKGYDHVSIKLNSRLYSSSSYISSSAGMPGENALSYLEQTENELEIVLDQINKFFEKSWPAYQQEIEKAQLSVFKEYKPIQLEKR
ncbi:hypothetical protein JYT51_00920 [Candidatus Amoebophilus asiaticus]|nr:hypothetical protein [Candidatus Amoebophilus asiaticus]